MMTAQEYVTKKAGIAGGIRALVDAQAPCATGCGAHPHIVSIHKKMAESIETDGEFFGNGFGDTIAAKVCEKIKSLPVVPVPQTVKTVHVPTPWGVKQVSDAMLWRIAIILTIIIVSWLKGKPIGEEELIKAIHRAAGVQISTNLTARVP